MSNKPWRCRFGFHDFVVARNEDNQRYRRCRRCGKDDAGSTHTAGTASWIQVASGREPALSMPTTDNGGEDARREGW
jgi:hypothetical protein